MRNSIPVVFKKSEYLRSDGGKMIFGGFFFCFFGLSIFYIAETLKTEGPRYRSVYKQKYRIGCDFIRRVYFRRRFPPTLWCLFHTKATRHSGRETDKKKKESAG